MIVLGIDPGFAITGYGVIRYEGNSFKLLDYGTISTTPDIVFDIRLLTISRQLERIIDLYKPSQAAVEELFFNTNAKTAIKAAQGRGVSVVTCAMHGLEIFEYTPLQVKQAVVGYGRATKQQVQQMVKTILCLKEIPKQDDAADALAVAICHSHSSHIMRKIKGGE